MSPTPSAERAALAKAQENIAAARDLLADYPGIAASRAYYAMFYKASALLLRRGLSFKRHSAVIAAFGREFAKDDPTWRVHHAHLVRAEALRKEGDYDLYAHFDPAEIDELLGWAEGYLRAAENYLG